MYGGHNSRKPERHTQTCENQPSNTGHRTAIHANAPPHSSKRANTPQEATNRPQHNRAERAGANKDKAKQTHSPPGAQGAKGPAFNERRRAAPGTVTAVGPPCPPRTPPHRQRIKKKCPCSQMLIYKTACFDAVCVTNPKLPTLRHCSNTTNLRCVCTAHSLLQVT